MNTANVKEMDALGGEYLRWLKGNLIPFKKGEDQALSTPFLDPFNDGIEVLLDSRGEEMVLHDDGRTLDNLMDLGIQTDKSERRQAIIQNAIAGCGVRFNNGRLETVVNPANRAQRLHFLLTAILRLNDLWMSSVPRTSSDFFEMVKEYFDSHDVLYTANKSVTGRTVEHPIDFIIPLPKGRDRFIKLIAKPSLQSAKMAAFTWADLRDTEPTAERVILINDLVLDDSSDTNEAELEPVKTKSLSETAYAILQGYSNKIHRWSEAANDEGFHNLIRVA
jgi:Domain of unknown function DUF1828/Domain of unknown function DUF1829